MAKLTCKVCGYQAKNIEYHITTEHEDKGGLSWYVKEFGASVEDIVDPSLLTPGRIGRMKFDGIELPAFEIGKDFVPTVESHYHFPSVTKDVAQDILENKKIMLVGHTGTGKISLIQQMAARINQGVIRVNMNGQVTIGDFVGLWTAKAGEMSWIDGVLPYAMRKGYWLIVDEIDFAEPAILAVLNAVLEVNGTLCLKENGHEIVRPHKDFRIFATANTAGCMAQFRSLYQGANIMNEAFLDRWRIYKIGYLPPEIETAVLVATIPLREGAASVLVRVANNIRQAFEREEIACTFSLRRLIDWGQMIRRSKDAVTAAESTVFSKISKEDAEVIRGVIRNIIPPASTK